MPVIGQYKISEVADISFKLYRDYGKIVRLSGLIGRPDLLFVFDLDETEKVSKQGGIHFFFRIHVMQKDWLTAAHLFIFNSSHYLNFFTINKY